MDTRQIASILLSHNQTQRVFRGVYSLDHINQCHGQGVYVCNTDPSDMPGQHWITVAIREDGSGEYFDSFGLPPQKEEFAKFLNKETRQWTYNAECLQHPLSTVCGHYCVLYVLNYAKGRNLDHLLSKFDKNYLENDYVVHEYVSSAFGVNVPLLDVDMIVNQFGY